MLWRPAMRTVKVLCCTSNLQAKVPSDSHPFSWRNPVSQNALPDVIPSWSYLSQVTQALHVSPFFLLSLLTLECCGTSGPPGIHCSCCCFPHSLYLRFWQTQGSCIWGCCHSILRRSMDPEHSLSSLEYWCRLSCLLAGFYWVLGGDGREQREWEKFRLISK